MKLFNCPKVGKTKAKFINRNSNYCSALHHKMYFLNRMLQPLRDNIHEDILVLYSEFFKDLAWFNTFLHTYNGVTIYQVTPVYHRIFLNASLQGMGCCFNNYVYSLTIPLGFKNYNIAQLEMINVMVALKVWTHCWSKNAFEFSVTTWLLWKFLPLAGPKRPLWLLVHRIYSF